MNPPDRSDADDLEIDNLLTDDERRLAIALDTGPPPLPDSQASDCVACHRKLNLEEQRMADPIRDHVPQTASSRKTRGVLAILDQLANQKSNRRFNH